MNVSILRFDHAKLSASGFKPKLDAIRTRICGGMYSIKTVDMLSGGYDQSLTWWRVRSNKKFARRFWDGR